MSGFFIALIATSWVLSVAACLFAARIAARVQELADQLQRLPVSQLQSLAKSVTETQDVLSELAQRVKMMKVRNAVHHVKRGESDEPDARLDPEAWRRWKNAQLRAGEFNS